MDGREPQLLFLISFLASFGFIRTSAHMIRAQVSWWPGNVQVGGTHIHHLVWGILLILICGYVGTVERPDTPWWHLAIIGFGIGTGLAMDEFALWLNLRDVYWEEEGRRSIDAVIVVAILGAIAVVGFREWVDAAESVEAEIFGLVAGAGVIVVIVALTNAAKEKFGMAVLTFPLPPVGIVTAFRLGKPTSLWARAFYSEAKLVKARERFG
jgi:hypothetical protein